MYKCNTKNLSLGIPLLLVLVGFALPAHGKDLGSSNNQPIGTMSLNLPGNFNNVGIFRGIDGAERSMTISGQKYLYGINTKAYNKDSKSLPIQSIPSNATLGFNFTMSAKGQPLLYEIWVLPKGQKLPFVTETIN